MRAFSRFITAIRFYNLSSFSISSGKYKKKWRLRNNFLYKRKYDSVKAVVEMMNARPQALSGGGLKWKIQGFLWLAVVWPGRFFKLQSVFIRRRN